MSEKTRVTKAAGIVGTATFLSRIFGYIRDMVFALFFGAGPVSDAFIAAFRIPNLLRRLFGEGSLTIAFIPVFTEYLTNDGKEEAFRLAGAAVRLLSILLVITAVIGTLLSPLIMKVVAFGFTDAPETFSLSVTLARIMFPYVVFICLVAFSMGVLNAFGHFAAPALAPVFLNLGMIGAMVTVSLFTEDMTLRAYGLAVGVLIGGLMQLALQIPFLARTGFYFWHRARLFHPGLKRIGILMLPATFGAAVFQINTLIQTLLASFLPVGSLSYLYYADRLVQFPLAIFGIAVATAVLPSLSRQAAANDYDALKDTFAFSVKLVFFITVPSMAGLIVLREPIVALLFKRGAFGADAVKLTALALLYYSIGLWAFSSVRILYNTFYALQDTKTPVKMAVISIVANVVFGLLLMKPMGHAGLALSLSLSSILNLVLLIRALRIRLGGLRWGGVAVSACKTLLSSAIMGMGVWWAAGLVLPPGNTSTPGLLLGIIGSILAGILLYGLCAYFVRSPELETFIRIARKGILRR
jgi:putative peptidoglycan lipid II flippase